MCTVLRLGLRGSLLVCSVCCSLFRRAAADCLSLHFSIASTDSALYCSLMRFAVLSFPLSGLSKPVSLSVLHCISSSFFLLLFAIFFLSYLSYFVRFFGLNSWVHYSLSFFAFRFLSFCHNRTGAVPPRCFHRFETAPLLKRRKPTVHDRFNLITQFLL